MHRSERLFFGPPFPPSNNPIFRGTPAFSALARGLQFLMVNKEGTMKPRTLIVATGLAMAAAALAAPAHAQSARITVGAVFTAGPQYPQRPPSPQQRPSVAERRGPDGYGGYGWRGSREVALKRGFDDGHAQGIDASRRRDRYDPWREGWYRHAERGYNWDYRMSRDEYPRHLPARIPAGLRVRVPRRSARPGRLVRA